MRISDWSSDVCSSDLRVRRRTNGAVAHRRSDRDQSFRRAAAGRCRSIRRHEEEREFLAQIFVVEPERSEEHTSELQSLMRISYAVLCLKKKKKQNTRHNIS